MRRLRRTAVLTSGVLGLVMAASHGLGQAPTPAGQTPNEDGRPHKSAYGTLESVVESRNGVIMKSDAGERLAWQFDAPVVAEIAKFKPGDPMIVIYRQISASEKRVTAVAFPGKAETPTYQNMTGSRIHLRSAPKVDGVCGKEGAGPISEFTIPDRGRGEAVDACWCCALDGETCTPGNKSGVGLALLVRCFK